MKKKIGWYEYDYDHDPEKERERERERERENVQKLEDFFCLSAWLSLLCCFVFSSNQSILFCYYSYSHLCDLRVSQIKLKTPCLCKLMPHTQQHITSLAVNFDPSLSPFSPIFPFFFLLRFCFAEYSLHFFTLNFLSRRLIHCVHQNVSQFTVFPSF